MKRRDLKEGQFVILKANKREGWPREVGQILGLEGNGTVMVHVDDTENDDGLREITVSQIERQATRRDLKKAGWSNIPTNLSGWDDDSN